MLLCRRSVGRSYDPRNPVPFRTGWSSINVLLSRVSRACAVAEKSHEPGRRAGGGGCHAAGVGGDGETERATWAKDAGSNKWARGPRGTQTSHTPSRSMDMDRRFTFFGAFLISSTAAGWASASCWKRGYSGLRVVAHNRAKITRLVVREQKSEQQLCCPLSRLETLRTQAEE